MPTIISFYWHTDCKGSTYLSKYRWFCRYW